MDSAGTVDAYANGFPIAKLKYQNTEVLYGVPNRTALWRIESFDTKEPETVKWISRFGKGEIFVDIGANMGLYSLLAAVHSGARVFAFEPEAQNYALLNRNIHLNAVSERVVAWCCALTDQSCADRLYMSSFDTAQSGHEFGAEVNPILQPTKAAFVQGSFGFALDDLVEQGALPVPDHIKIDVDGIEHHVVKGAEKTIAHPNLSSVLIEISPYIEAHAALIKVMADKGFSFDPEQVERARRKEGQNKDYAEYIFRR